ncbi:MAG: sensor histidine kinase [Bradymonadia bacterium]
MKSALIASAPIARLQWLVRLRWLALCGVSVGAVMAAWGVVPGVNLPLVAGAVLIGLLSNGWLHFQSRRRPTTDEHYVGQALLDTGALTLVIWASGGASNPFISFYVFPILLAGLLGGRAALPPTALATVVGISFQIITLQVPALQVGTWDPIPQWSQLLFFGSIVITVGVAGYFATRFTEALRQQIKAREKADRILELTFEGLEAGLEVVERGALIWQNPKAIALVGPRTGQWHCPGKGQCALGLEMNCASPGASSSPRRCQFPVHVGSGSEQIYELVNLPLPDREGWMVLYLDRTTEVLAERQLVFTERLASLGRTVQGVAHELNTPLSTIQTLARDVQDALSAAELQGELREDLDESAGIITAEVDRCRRITHALLGRAEFVGGGGLHRLGDAVQRAVAVAFPHQRDRVDVTLGRAADVHLPLDPIMQVLVNLLQNAGDADPEGRLQLTARKAHNGVEIKVRDHGSGVPPEVFVHLFEPFFTTKPPGKGTGLGLFTSYELIRKLGGTLQLENHSEGGAQATIRLPVTGDPPQTDPSLDSRSGPT